MSVIGVRQAVERAIAKATIAALLRAGHSVTVFDGEAEPVKESQDADAILAAMFSTDEDYLIVETGAWVRFVYGNEGPDVICDYNVSLEDTLKPVNEMADRIEAGSFEVEVSR